MQPASDEALAVFHEKEPLGVFASHALEQFANSTRVRSHDASRQQVGKRECVLPPDLGIEKPRRLGGKQRLNAAWGSRSKNLPERRDGGRIGNTVYVVKPADPSGSVIGAPVEKGSPLRGKFGLEARYVVEVEPEDGQPVGEPIVGDAAEREDLFDPRAVAGKSEIVIEIVGHNVVGQPFEVQSDFT